MSEQDKDKPRKRVHTGSGSGSGTGRSGSARSIGAELGGGLDFEPDALLDSLLSDEEGSAKAPPVAVPRPPQEAKIAELPPTSQAGQKLLEPDKRLYPADEVTLVGEMREGGEFERQNVPPPAPSARPELDAQGARRLAAPPPPARVAPPRPPSPPRPPAPPRPPRPGPVPLPAGVRPLPEPEFPSADDGPTLAGAQLEDLAAEPFDDVPPEDLDESEFEEIGLAAPPPDTDGEEIETAPPPPPDSASAFAAAPPLAFLESIDDDDATSVLSRPPSFAQPARNADQLDREVDAMFGSAPPPPSFDERVVQREEDWEAGEIDEHGGEQSAASQLSERSLLDEWIARAEWFEEEAHSMADPQARARTLIVASELWAMTGDLSRAREVASEAQAAAANKAVVARQIRQLAAADGDWNAVAAALEIEIKTSASPETRAHAAHLSAEVHRFKLGDEAAAKKRFDLIARVAPSDARPHVARLASKLGQSGAPPDLAIPDAPGLERLASAWRELISLRGGTIAAEGEPSAQVRFAEAHRALSAGERARAGAAIAALSEVRGLELAAPWLASALLAVKSATRPLAIELLKQLLERERTPAAERALASRALEQGDASAVTAAIATEGSEAFTPADRVALAALTGGAREAVQPWLPVLAAHPEQRALAAAASSAAEGPEVLPNVLAGSEQSRTEVALGREVVAPKSNEEQIASFRMAQEAYAIVHDGEPLVQTLALELALAERAADRVAQALTEWQGEVDQDAKRDRHLAAATVYDLAKQPASAAQELAAALETDPSCEAAARALIGDAPAERAVDLLVALGEAKSEPSTRALLLTEAALRLGPEGGERYGELLERASQTLPSLPLAHRLAEQLARSRGDVDALLSWLRSRREGSTDQMERALDMVREALLVAENDFELATSLLEEASQARTHDVALRELHERLAGGVSPARGAWREEVAAALEGPLKARILLEAALEYERAGELDSAARTAAAAGEAEAGDFAQLVSERAAAQGAGAGRLAERLFSEAREEQDPIKQRELYERLSLLDAARGDHSSALLWQSAILERTPDYLPALRRLEHAYISSGRDEELEPTASALAGLLDRGEVSAHAMIGARLRIRGGNWASARELVDLAYKQEHPSLWALRAESAHARIAGDDATLLAADRQLSERANRAIDAATLALRAAEAASRLGEMADAKELLDRAVEMVPEHPIALATLAEVLEVSGDPRGSAEALEQIATSSGVEAHRLEAWHAAAVTWLDKADDAERGKIALEHAAAIDITHEDVFIRLQSAYVAAGDRSKLAELLEKRLQHVESPDERAALEISRGRALAEMGERAAAKEALAAALEANPDHADALDAFADLCVLESDWSGAEKSWTRLAELVSDSDRQVEIYTKLGKLYETDLPNPEQAEHAYKQVLERQPGSVPALERLVHVYGKLGDKDKALEIANQLVESAESPDDKRDRTIGLAIAYEQVLGDRKKAEGVLDKARRTWPQDSNVLRALAEFHQRSGETRGLGILLDRAANDARRALSTGRFDRSFFETLGTVAELRGANDTAAIAKATLAALEGNPAQMDGAGAKAGDPRLDELLAPELLSLPLRSLLKKTGDTLDSAYPVDFRVLRATPLPEEGTELDALVQRIASAFGLAKVELMVSPGLGAVCMPAGSLPPRVIFGQPMIDSDDQAVREFAVVRALKIIQGRGAALSRLAPIDLWPTMAAFLSQFAPNWQPTGVDAKRFSEAQARIKPAMPARVDDDAPVLALEVIGAIGNRASQLAIAIGQWGDRAGLLAVGDPSVAIRGIALAGGHAEGPPAEGPDRLKWIVRNPEARDLAIFSVSEQYAEARRRVGLG